MKHGRTEPNSEKKLPQKKMKQQRLCPSVYPPRAPVGDPMDWADASYAPHFFEAGVLGLKPSWAGERDPPLRTLRQTLTFGSDGSDGALVPLSASDRMFDSKKGRFLNPRGKTGLEGRGLLGMLGPNHAADVIVTRRHGGVNQVLLVVKHSGDRSALAFPAGMVDPGEDVPTALKRELTEEAVAPGIAVDELFEKCRRKVVYRGIVDDFRNTDHAWMETTAVWFHASRDIGKRLETRVHDTEEIRSVSWYDIEDVKEMYASHYDWLVEVRCELRKSLPFVSHAVACGLLAPFVSHIASDEGGRGQKRPLEE